MYASTGAWLCSIDHGAQLRHYGKLCELLLVVWAAPINIKVLTTASSNQQLVAVVASRRCEARAVQGTFSLGCSSSHHGEPRRPG